VTGDDGRYSFSNLPAEGGYTVTPSKDGYTFEPASFSTDFLGYYDRTENFRAVRNTPVTVQVTSPSWFAQYTASATVTINAAASSTAGAITQVDFAYRTASGASFHIGTDTTAPYSFDWTNVPAGDYYVYAIATDSTGETNTSDATPITVNPAPSIVRINGQVTDGGGSGMSGLRVTLSGTRTATAVTNSMGYYVFGNLPAGGSYTVTAPANYTFTPPSYTFNNLTADELSVDFNTTSFNTAPSVALTSPTDGLIVNAPADITLSATASDSDGTVTRVSFYNGATLIGSDTSAPYSFVWGVTTPGTYTITAAAWDNGGLRTISSAVTITVKASSAQTGSPVIEGGGFASLLNASGQTWTPLEAGNHLAPSILTTSVTDGAQALALPIEWSEQSFDGLALEGDYDGDGQIDLAVYRPSDGRWYLLKSSS
jgi:hypothetical protein